MYRHKRCSFSKLTGSGISKWVLKKPIKKICMWLELGELSEGAAVCYLLKIVSHGWAAFPGIKILAAENEVLGTSLIL